MYSSVGYALPATPLFRVDNGQIYPGGADTVAEYAISAARLPTELIYYVGGTDGGNSNTGMKYARWNWSSTQANTVFEVINASASVVLSNNNSSTLSWKTFGSLNNAAMALVKISNPDGISDFAIRANRLDAAGDDMVYTNVNQAADYSGAAILVPLIPNTAPTAIPSLSGTLTEGSAVSGAYQYADADSDAEDAGATGSSYKFVVSANPAIANSSEGNTVSQGATGGANATLSYTLTANDVGMYVYFCVTPVAAAGETQGVEVCTSAAGPVVAKPLPPSPALAAAPVPALGAWGLLGLSSILAIFGLARRRWS